MKLVFATNNTHKLREVREILSDLFEILSLTEIGCLEDIPETSPTIEGNALQKARFVKEKYGYDCFADDTGLEVEALNGEPGVYSARYAGKNVSFEQNVDKLMKKMQGIENRNARFKTVIALILDGKEYLFEGLVPGTISVNRKGNNGFGYDPVFVPEGMTESYAELAPENKNRISHRAVAVQKLIHFLKS